MCLAAAAVTKQTRAEQLAAIQAKKDRKGVRMVKTGAKKHKFDLVRIE
eukprot:SAG22_NODE_315_length_12535_cov_3.240351_7_plen_48_part_00